MTQKPPLRKLRKKDLIITQKKPKKVKLTHYARTIKIEGEEVRTRLTKREFAERKEIFEMFYSEDLGGYDYLEFVE